MKPKISFMTMFLSLSILLFLLSATTCEKERSPCKDPGKCIDISSGNSEKPLPALDEYPDSENYEFTDLDRTFTFAQAKESIDFDVHPDWGVDIKSFTCIRSGQSLVVYNPRSHNFDYYDSPKFAIYWFKDEKPIRGTNRVECACNGEFAAIVIHKPTNRGIGIAFYSVPACAAEDFSTIYNTDKE